MIQLKYGCNPNQKIARVIQGDNGPLRVRNGSPSYINVLDGLRGWQLVRELKAGTGKPAAASFKHVSPAGAAVAGELTPEFRKAHFVDAGELSPVATAYAKARSSDRVASFGDFIAVSEVVDATLAGLVKPEVSDGIIAPGFDPEAFGVLAAKKGGKYVILEMDPSHEPAAMDSRTEFGITLEQSYNDAVIDRSLLKNIVTQNRTLPEEVIETILVSTITLKHTQSNSIAVGCQGQAVGIGAGQQSRIACTRLACDKADRWLLKMHPKSLGLGFDKALKRSEVVNLVDMFVRYEELDDLERAQFRGYVTARFEPITPEERAQWLGGFDGLVCSSDAFFPFRDNLDRAARSGVKVIVQAGGSARDADVIAAADEHGMVMCMTGLRLFLH